MEYTTNGTKFIHKENEYYICVVAAKILTEITYVARRGVDEEQGAIQRILNKSRISGIRDFLLNNGFFPNNVILNIKEDANIKFNENNNEISFDRQPRIAQIIDGQHRIEGIREAIKNDESVGNMQIPTVIGNNLTTATCAEIFVSINTEQKSVPKSLIYDLYGLMNISAKDFSIERGTDIAKALNIDDTSPYQGYIKFPGSRKFKGGIQLSSVVNNLKPLVKTDGEFSKYSLATLENQTGVIKNLFNSIQYYYDDQWDTLQNPFIFASGFSAAIEVFITKILPICFAKKDFTEDFIKQHLVIPKDKLVNQAEVKGMSGEAAKELIKSKLIDFISIDDIIEEEFKI